MFVTKPPILFQLSPQMLLLQRRVKNLLLAIKIIINVIKYFLLPEKRQRRMREKYRKVAFFLSFSMCAPQVKLNSVNLNSFSIVTNEDERCVLYFLHVCHRHHQLKVLAGHSGWNQMNIGLKPELFSTEKKAFTYIN